VRFDADGKQDMFYIFYLLYMRVQSNDFIDSNYFYFYRLHVRRPFVCKAYINMDFPARVRLYVVHF
jgi:hypothetical protein